MNGAVQDPLLPQQPKQPKPIANLRWLLFGLTGFAAILLFIQFSRSTPEPAATRPKPDKSTAGTADQVRNFEAQQLKAAQELRQQAAAAQAAKDQAEELSRTLAGYRAPGEAAGVPPPTEAQRRAMEGGVMVPPTSGQTENGGVSPERAAQIKAAEERVAAEKAAQESSTVAIDFSDQLERGTPVAAKQEATEKPLENREKDSAREELPASPATRMFKILEGTLLEGVLTNRLAGAISGPVNVMLTTPTYSHDRGTLLLPQGTRILGTVNAVRGQGDERLFVAFHRAILPTGFAVNLDQFTGLSQQGQTGLRDKVNHHYFEIFGASVALAAIQGLSQAASNVGNGNATIRLQGGVATGSANGSAQIIEQMLQRLPTFTIRERTRVKVYVSRDLAVPAYDPNFKLDPL